jgi:hypothetical protein
MITFEKLWEHHPGLALSPCSFPNQCAIRMGVALAECKADLSSFKGTRCWEKGHTPKHILRAQELADWMAKNQALFGERKAYKRKKDSPKMSDFVGKRGIIFIKDGWGSTDHIDLWDGYSMKAGDSSYFSKGIEI